MNQHVDNDYVVALQIGVVWPATSNVTGVTPQNTTSCGVRKVRDMVSRIVVETVDVNSGADVGQVIDKNPSRCDY